MNTVQNNSIVNGSNEKITYHEFGLKEAEKAQGSPEHLNHSLSILFNKIEEESREDKESVRKKIMVLQNEQIDNENKKNSISAIKGGKEETIKHKQKQIDDIENNKGSSDYATFAISALITLLLTFYLWAFYSASGYAAFNGVKQGTTGFAGIFGALSEAFNKGGFVVVLTVLFPVVFLGLGFLIHDALEKKSYAIIAVLLLFTLCFDAIIGYQITMHIHNNSYRAGLTEIEWKGSLIFEDINFYLVLASGFVCYIMWGFLLNYTLNKYKEIQPDERILKLKKEIIELQTEIQKDNSDIEVIQIKIDNNKKLIAKYEEGKVVIDITKLKSNIGQFYGGWSAWINLMKSDESADLLNRANMIKEEWLTNKINEIELV